MPLARFSIVVPLFIRTLSSSRSDVIMMKETLCCAAKDILILSGIFRVTECVVAYSIVLTAPSSRLLHFGFSRPCKLKFCVANTVDSQFLYVVSRSFHPARLQSVYGMCSLLPRLSFVSRGPRRVPGSLPESPRHRR